MEYLPILEVSDKSLDRRQERCDLRVMFLVGHLPRGVIQPAMRLRPPDLIIQDELHLISDALGSMVGLYETAIDRLSSRGPIRPVLVASTATVRRARDQVEQVFERAFGVHQPEQGRGRRLPRQLRQLVHRRDDQAGREPVDLLVDGEHRQYTSTRRRSRLVCTLADDSRDPHHGHTGSCSTPPSTRSKPRDSVICRSASSKEFGDTDEPTGEAGSGVLRIGHRVLSFPGALRGTLVTARPFPPAPAATRLRPRSSATRSGNGTGYRAGDVQALRSRSPP
jgi:hypothetical protein